MTDTVLAACIQAAATVLAAVLAVVLARWLPSSPPVAAVPTHRSARINSSTCIIRSTRISRIISSTSIISSRAAGRSTN